MLAVLVHGEKKRFIQGKGNVLLLPRSANTCSESEVSVVVPDPLTSEAEGLLRVAFPLGSRFIRSPRRLAVEVTARSLAQLKWRS
jgi:hypothetical protein